MMPFLPDGANAPHAPHAACADHARLSRQCAENVQKCAGGLKQKNPTRNLTVSRGILVRSRELESRVL